jgi:hypothetical protein
MLQSCFFIYHFYTNILHDTGKSNVNDMMNGNKLLDQDF